MVESCVNYVGVDVNTASPRFCDTSPGWINLLPVEFTSIAASNGPFRSREQLLRGGRFRRRDIRAGGRLPQDCRRRESAGRYLDSSGELSRRRQGHGALPAARPSDLAEKEAAAALAQRMAAVKLEELAKNVAEKLAKQVAEKPARERGQYRCFPENRRAATG